VREINVNPYIMNFKNGLYNIHTDTISEHNPKVLSTIQLNANYGTNAECPVLMEYLDDVLPKSEHALVQEMLGYILIAVTKAQKAFLLVGNKDSGKSTMLYLINTLLGEDNYSTLTWQNLDERFATFQLFGKLANVFADLPSQSLKDTGNFKAITGVGCAKRTKPLFPCQNPDKSIVNLQLLLTVYPFFRRLVNHDFLDKLVQNTTVK